MKKTFFKRVIVSDEVQKPKSELERLEEKDSIKKFKIEVVASDCDDSIKEMLGEEVVIDFLELTKLKTKDNRNYYLTHQNFILYC